MKPKADYLSKFSLEQCKDGIVFIDGIPLFIEIEHVARQLQVDVWLDSSTKKIILRDYIR